jgi:glyoxylase-like metal-dependent hydrolase (beta-lactamase superfamily II)
MKRPYLTTMAIVIGLWCGACATGGKHTPAQGGLEKISNNVYLFRDTCNVYVLKQRDKAILIDFGAGTVMSRLPEIGVKKIDWVLHTHYHRDQCQGDGALESLGVKIAVPAAQRRFFDQAEATWDDSFVFYNYGWNWDFFIPEKSVKVDRAIKPGETFEWEGLKLDTLPAVGPTKEAGLTYIAKIDGNKIAFTGDLIHSPGKLWTYHDLQWNYMCLKAGAAANIKSLKSVRETQPDILAPSHGIPMIDPVSAIDQTVAKLEGVIEHLPMLKAKTNDPKLINGKIFPHIYHKNTSFFIVADNGHALFYDFRSNGGFAEKIIDELKSEMGLKQIDLVMPSHYHDDHVLGLAYLQKQYGTPLWAHESVADVLNNPKGYNIPCLAYGFSSPEDTPKVNRVLKEGETFEWQGWKFTVFHFPGQTEYHQGMFAEIDGRRMLFLGDSTYRPEEGTPFRGGLFNCRNYCKLGEHVGYMKCADMLEKYKPDTIMAAHMGAIFIDEYDIETYRDWSEKLEPMFADLLARENPNFGTDPNWASVYPYRSLGEAGESFPVQIRIRNHLDRNASATVTPALRENWRVDIPRKEITIPAKSTGVAEFVITAPRQPELPLRTVLTANIVFDGIDYGPLAEMIVDKRSREDYWPKWRAAKIQAARNPPENEYEDSHGEPEAPKKKKSGGGR